MNLEDLFISYNQVTPVEFIAPEDSNVDDGNIYINFQRAKKASEPVQNEPEETLDIEDSELPTIQNGFLFDWKVLNYKNPLEYDEEDTQFNSTTPFNSEAAAKAAKSNGNQSQPVQKQTKKPLNKSQKTYINKAKYWMQQFERFGITPEQQIAIVAAMSTECNLEPKGAVEKKELAGKGNTKAGWAHAGEGSIGFTHWETKRKIIERFNADPRRKGPKLPVTEVEYAKNNARHIVDLDDEDHALITYLFYENLLNKTKNLNFNDLMGEFYMEKAGRGFGQRKGAGSTPYQKAVYTGKVYQRSHAKMGYIKASKTNTFLKSLNNAKVLADGLGFTV